uniref:tRNA(Met) cytidine acetyltransferase TmcA n=1 Tax=Ignisphaera aggregans TaxID=334771 RepID=A0A7C2ZN11_9CREN
MAKGLSRLKDRIEEYVSGNFKNLKTKLKREIAKALDNRYRLMVMLSGDDVEKQGVFCVDLVLSYIKWVLSKKKHIKILYIYHDEFEDATYRKMIFERFVKRFIEKHKLRNSVEIEIAVYEGCERFLGTTYQLLVMDLVNSLKPNDVGRLVNIIEGGGMIIAFTPKWSEWSNRKNLFQMSLAVPQHPEPRKIFVRWFQTISMLSKGIIIYDVDGDNIIKFDELDIEKTIARPISIPSNTRFPRELYQLALTQDQVEAIKIVEELIEQPKNPYKRASVVLIADRGRGKSCAIGIALVGLIGHMLNVRNRIRIAVTAPELSNVQALMTLARKALNSLGMEYRVIEKDGMILEIKGERFSIEYWNPASVVKQDVDIVAVDEAAGIPVPLLHKIWRKFKRTIFATTIHGYEGAGRGFSVRFLKRLKEDASTKLIIFEMEEPIRYSASDPVERWVFRVLLLDAEPDELTEDDLKHIERKEFVYLVLDPEKLFTVENEETLRKLFGIYVLAHYRNEPDDLGMIADAPHHSIRGLALPNGKIVAAAQLAEEGPIPDEYIDSLLRGGKIPGNIIPDRLLKHGRLRDIAYGKGWRIVRIAVHPEVQGRGIGSYLLSMLIKEAIERGYDWIGSGFGATEELLKFWLKNGFIAIHISPDRNPVSAEYTVLVLRPLNDKWKEIVRVLYSEFKEKVIESLYDTYKDLEVEVAYLLLNADKYIDIEESADSNRCKNIEFTAIQLDRLLSYIEGYMTYESCNDVLLKLVKHYWLQPAECRKLAKFEELVTIIKVLQGSTWELSAEILHTFRGKVIDTVRDIAERLVEQFIGIKKEDVDKNLGKISLHHYRPSTS